MLTDGSQLYELIQKVFTLKYVETNRVKFGLSFGDFYIIKTFIDEGGSLSDAVEKLQATISPSFRESDLLSRIYGYEKLLWHLVHLLQMANPQIDEHGELLVRFSFLHYQKYHLKDTDGTQYIVYVLSIKRERFWEVLVSEWLLRKLERTYVFRLRHGKWRLTQDKFAKSMQFHRSVTGVDEPASRVVLERLKYKQSYMINGGNHLAEMITYEVPLEKIEMYRGRLGLSDEDLETLRVWQDCDYSPALTLSRLTSLRGRTQTQQVLHFVMSLAIEVALRIPYEIAFDEQDRLLKPYSFLDYEYIENDELPYCLVSTKFNTRFRWTMPTPTQRKRFEKTKVYKKDGTRWKETNDEFAQLWLETYVQLNRLSRVHDPLFDDDDLPFSS